MYRKGTLEDCRNVYELICDMEQKRLPYTVFLEIYQKQITDTRYYCLLREEEGHVIGVMNLRFEEQLHHADRIGEIMEFAVEASWRNRGIGKEIFAQACQIARNLGCIQIEVACNQLRADTHRFYLREGMHNFHYKFSKALIGEDTGENMLGK